MTNTKPARGMRDFLPSDVRKREYVIGIIKAVYESYGFEPLETPAVENIETLTGKYGEEGSQLIYKILKRGEKLDANAGEKDLADLALRYDLTVPLARVVANHRNDLPKFFKRYQIQPVWRADRPARGRFREFYQCDVDAIGSSSMIVEVELISAVGEILHKLDFKDFKIKINHRQVLHGILDAAEIDKRNHAEALVALDKYDKIGLDGVNKELEQRNVSDKSSRKLLKFILDTSDTSNSVQSRNNNNLRMTGEFISTHNEGRNGVDELKAILSNINPYLDGFVEFDTKLARGLSYYTGAIFEIELEDNSFNVSLGGGGRYDGLIGMFGKEQIPACGFSLGLERILVVMEERGMFQKLVDEGKLKLDSADVLVTVWNEETISESLKLAGELRKENLRVLVYPETDKLGKQFKYADSLGIQKAIILRDDEIAENKVKIKNLITSEETIVSREEILTKIK